MDEVQRTIEKTLAKRNKARRKKLWSVADELRDLLGDLGVVVQDTGPETSTWRWKKGALSKEEPAAAPEEASDGEEEDSDESEDEPATKKRPAADDDDKPAKKLRKTFPGGLVATIIKPGSGKKAQLKKKITMQYVGTLASNGREFDRGKIAFRLGAGEVIKGWDVGCAGMAVGERRELKIPSKMGYGRSGAPPDIPPNADLVFDCVLLKA